MPQKQINKAIGIDYGSKLAGTTAICFSENSKLKIIQSEKKRDADEFILNFCERFKPELVFIDAPLSLPAAYFSGASQDFFYRAADRETQAMSPMFLGGLTARAIKLKSQLTTAACEVMETYPKKVAYELMVTRFYKENLEKFRDDLSDQLEYEVPAFKNWHQADAALAYCSANRYINNSCKIIGDKKEGLIYI